MEQAEALERLARTRIGRFATSGSDDGPHVVPVTFTVVGTALVHMVDHKPKTTYRLKRILNLEEEARASLLVDHYDEDWEALWWVRVDGLATVVSSGPEWEIARAALADKYPQYVEESPDGPAIYLSMDRVTSWESTN